MMVLNSCRYRYFKGMLDVDKLDKRVVCLDMESMLCKVVDLNYTPPGGCYDFATLGLLNRFSGKDACWVCSENLVTLHLRGIQFDFRVNNSKLYCNGVTFIKFNHRSSFLGVGFICDSEDGVYHVRLKHGRYPVESIDFWLDTETKGILGYSHLDTGYIEVCKSELQHQKSRRLQGRMARSALLGVGRIY